VLPFYLNWLILTPSFPLSFKGEGEDIKKRGFAPLRYSSQTIYYVKILS